jgi:YgiT-type zinc finger domain-containing protein
MINCSIRDCSGQYEKKFIPYVLKHKGEIIVLENVSAEVCSVCGDVLLSLETAEAIEAILKNPGIPSDRVPVYKMPEFAEAA